MPTISPHCEAVLITNGRSTFKYALKALEEQSVPMVVHIIKNRGWLEANNLALKLVSTPLFVRVDDDMFLHPGAVEFLLKTMPGWAVMHRGKLYEPHTKRIAGRVKVYRVAGVESLGGFTANRLGKIDRAFEKSAGAARISIGDKQAPVGIHGCAPWKEQARYERLWGHHKSTRNAMRSFKTPVREQYEMRTWKPERIAKQRNSRFWRWLNAHR